MIKVYLFLLFLVTYSLFGIKLYGNELKWYTVNFGVGQEVDNQFEPTMLRFECIYEDKTDRRRCTQYRVLIDSTDKIVKDLAFDNETGLYIYERINKKD